MIRLSPTIFLLYWVERSVRLGQVLLQFLPTLTKLLGPESESWFEDLQMR